MRRDKASVRHFRGYPMGGWPLGWGGNGAKLRWMTATARVCAGRPGQVRDIGPPGASVVVLVRDEGKRKGHG
jgi:hypothetical protein